MTEDTEKVSAEDALAVEAPLTAEVPLSSENPLSSEENLSSEDADSSKTDSGKAAAITPEMMERFERLEAETKKLRAEVARLNAEKQNAQTAAGKAAVSNPTAAPSLTPPTTGSVPITGSPAADAGSVLTSNTVSVSPEETMTRAEVNAFIQRHIKDNAWKIGAVRVVPYGRVWVSVIGSSSRSAPQDAIHHILPSDAYGQNSVAFQARSSRLGLNISGPDLAWLGGMKSTGKVEIDFRNDLGNAENKGSVLLREVYWQLENDCWKIIFGQTKDVISPLNTGMLNYFNLWGAGNIGGRNPQFQLTRYFYLTPNTRMEVTSSISQMCGPDYVAYDSPGSYPTVMGRVGWTIAQGCRYPIQFGVSGHVGEEYYDFPGEKTRVKSWSANLDLSLPITDRFGVRGEFFTGQGLAGLFGGVTQSIDYSPVTRTGTKEEIRSTGGWAEIWWDWTPQLHYHLGYGIDDPNDEDMESAAILKNSVIYTSLVYDFSKFLRTGLEYSYWTTDYQDGYAGGDRGRAHVVEWMWQMDF